MDVGLKYDENGDIIVPPDGAQEGLPPPTPITNLAHGTSANALDLIGATLTTDIAHDQYSRADWEKLTTRFIEALGIGPESRPDDYEYKFADTSDHPLLLKALTNFQAKATSAIMPSPMKVATAEPDMDISSITDKAQQKLMRTKLMESAARVEAYYSWYMLEKLPAYVEDTDLIVNDCGLMGIGFRRIVVDTSFQTTPVRPIYVAPQNLIMSYDTRNLQDGGRVSHRYTVSTNDLLRQMQTGEFLEVEVSPSVYFGTDVVTEAQDRQYGIRPSNIVSNGEHVLYDVFTHLYLENDLHPLWLARPYVVTIHKDTQKVLAIRRNWDPADPDETPLEHFAAYVYSPGRSALSAVGLGALLTNITMALRKAQRRALDAAYLANHPSGFITSGISIRDDSTPFTPGELRPVDVSNGDLSRSILLNPFKGPDPGLISLYDRMNDSGKELGNIASIDFASMMKSGIAAGPALAAYDESTEFQTSVHMRLYRAHARELSIIHRHMRAIKGGQTIHFGAGRTLQPEDLQTTKLIPAMKPGHVSRQRVVMEAQAVMEVADKYGDVVDKREAVERYLVAIGVQNISTLLVPDSSLEPPPAMDPVNEYLRLMKGQPLRAAAQQNHKAHIQAHKAQLLGLQGSALPVQTGQAMSAALASHIAEHEAFDLAVAVSAATGIPLEKFEQGIPPEMEAQIAPILAQAIAQVEASRQERTDADVKLTIEQMRAETKLAVKQMEAADAERNRAAQVEITRLREQAETYRNSTDNYWAVEIAKLKTAKPPTDPGTTAPDNPNPTPRIAGQTVTT